MKTQAPSLRQRLSTLAALSLLTATTCPASSELPSGSGCAFDLRPGEALPRLTLTDPGNHGWIIQSSPDLLTWSTAQSLRVFNGSLRTSILADGTGGTRYFRALHVPTPDAALSTEALALNLPTPAANFANPLLPPAFLVPPISNQDNTPANNPVTNAGATLGRVLFYDKRLSLNQTVSCSSCHQQAHGFSDPAKFSTGFQGGLTGRNSMGLANARWYQRRAFFWDERAATLEAQVLQPIQNATEMGMTLTELETRISAEPFYSTLFTKAFGSSTVTSDRISRALAQFVRSIISTNTKFDTGAATAFANFTAQENLGRQIFNGQIGPATCTACHGTDNFVPGPAINNNGLEIPYIDKGVGAISGRAQDEGLFKVPSLRNIALTAPYMHDGRFATLEEVVEFYNSGVVDHPNLSPPLRRNNQVLRLNLTTAQKAALVAFLKTLSDTSLPTDARFSDPFRYGP
ncbi:MAG: cytochrome-c peroxidase [Verrucomicrobiales bacterium]|nr:cytochrome-c peroxidase [Verrucomicrobiales bacterium]